MRVAARTSAMNYSLSSLLLALTLPLPARAASPRDELLRLVPPDVGFCVIVQNLKDHFDALVNSPFIEQFTRTEVGAGLVKSPQAAQLLVLRDLLLGHIGLDAKELRDDIFGLAGVFAFRPGPPGKPQEDEGLLLLRARKAEALRNLIDKINQYQKKTDDLLALEEKEYQGIKYVRRAEKKDVAYYCLQGPILLLTSQEAMLRRALDRAAKAVTEPLLASQLRELGAEQALFTVWINPRPFDAAIVTKAAQAEGGPAAALQAFLRYWKALDGAAFSVHLDKDLAFSLALRARTETLPAAARRFLNAASRPSAVWQAFPEDALYAEGSRIDLAAYLNLLSDFLAKESRDKLHTDLNRYLGAPVGKDFVKEVLPCIGPDWGLCILAPRPEARSWLPEGIAVLRLSSGGAAEADKAVLSGLQFLAMLGVVAHNKEHPEHTLRLLTHQQGGKEIKYLAGEGALPPGLRPAFALDQGFLLLGTSPELLLQMSERLAAAPTAEAAESIPMMRLSFKAWRAYLKDHRQPLAEAIARQHQMDTADAVQALDRLQSGLQLLDRLEINQRPSAGQVILTLRVQMSQPLKK